MDLGLLALMGNGRRFANRGVLAKGILSNNSDEYARRRSAPRQRAGSVKSFVSLGSRHSFSSSL